VKNSHRSLLLSAILAVTTAVIIGAPLQFHAPWDFTWVLIGMLGFCVGLGLLFEGNPLGILITERNTMSLSRLQLVLWTCVILASYMTMALARLATLRDAPLATALAVKIPDELLLLMGISLTSSVGSSLVTNIKAQKVAEPRAAAAATAVSGPGAGATGVLYSRGAAFDPVITDLFEGDELTDTNVIDVAKVQMFFFTLVAITAYVIATFRVLGSGALDQLPLLPQQLIILMGMSHAGYLGNKLPTKTPEQPLATQPAAAIPAPPPADPQVQQLVTDVAALRADTSVVRRTDSDYVALLKIPVAKASS
jgi:hypothetical protein